MEKFSWARGSVLRWLGICGTDKGEGDNRRRAILGELKQSPNQRYLGLANTVVRYYMQKEITWESCETIVGYEQQVIIGLPQEQIEVGIECDRLSLYVATQAYRLGAYLEQQLKPQVGNRSQVARTARQKQGELVAIYKQSVAYFDGRLGEEVSTVK